jgi:hypothetical protein
MHSKNKILNLLIIHSQILIKLFMMLKNLSKEIPKKKKFRKKGIQIIN